MRTLIGVALAIMLLLELGGRFVVSQPTFEDDLLPRVLEEHRAKINERTAEGISTDLMFFGTSSTGAAFDPAMVPCGTAYDMWRADAAIHNHFATDFANKLVDPQTVVIGITSRANSTTVGSRLWSRPSTRHRAPWPGEGSPILRS